MAAGDIATDKLARPRTEPNLRARQVDVTASPNIETTVNVSTEPLQQAQYEPKPSPKPHPSTPAPKTSGPQAGKLRLDLMPFDGGIDLAEHGSQDWIMWGYKASDATATDRFSGGWVSDECPQTQCANRKRTQTPLISNYTVLGEGCRPFRLNDRFGPAWSWDAGTPTETVAAARGEVYIGIANCGFSLTVKTSQTQRVMRLYLAVYQGQARISAELSDGSAARVTSSSLSATQPGAVQWTVATFTHRASAANQTLHITVMLETDSGGANVSMSAATLS